MSKPHLTYKKQTPRERDISITLIACFKFLKGLLLLIIGIKLLTLINRDVGDWAMDFVHRHGIDADNRVVHSILEKLDSVDNTQLMTLGIGSFLYSSLLMTEGVGLWFEKRWAEFLTVISTALLLPFEMFEIYEKFTLIRIGILIINLVIVYYLITRLRQEIKVEKEENATTE